MAHEEKEKFGYIFISDTDHVPIKIFWRDKNAIIVINDFGEDEEGVWVDVEYQGGVSVEKEELDAFVIYLLEKIVGRELNLDGDLYHNDTETKKMELNSLNPQNKVPLAVILSDPTTHTY